MSGSGVVITVKVGVCVCDVARVFLFLFFAAFRPEAVVG